jgi:hypothetical protein
VLKRLQHLKTCKVQATTSQIQFLQDLPWAEKNSQNHFLKEDEMLLCNAPENAPQCLCKKLSHPSSTHF